MYIYVCGGHFHIIMYACVSHCPEGWRWRYSSWGEEASELTFEPLPIPHTACVVVGGGLMKSSLQDQGEMWHIYEATGAVAGRGDASEMLAGQSPPAGDQITFRQKQSQGCCEVI